MSPETREPDIRLNEEESRFEASAGGGTATLRFRRLDDRTLDYASTVVPPEARGQGIAGKLVRYALDWAREKGYKVVPGCSYVEAWIARHPDYQDLVAER